MTRPWRLYVVSVLSVLVVFAAGIAGQPPSVECPPLPLYGPSLRDAGSLYVLQLPQEPPTPVLIALDARLAKRGITPPVVYLGSTYRNRLYLYTFRIDDILSASQALDSRYITVVYNPVTKRATAGE